MGAPVPEHLWNWAGHRPGNLGGPGAPVDPAGARPPGRGRIPHPGHLAPRRGVSAQPRDPVPVPPGGARAVRPGLHAAGGGHRLRRGAVRPPARDAQAHRRRARRAPLRDFPRHHPAVDGEVVPRLARTAGRHLRGGRAQTQRLWAGVPSGYLRPSGRVSPHDIPSTAAASSAAEDPAGAAIRHGAGNLPAYGGRAVADIAAQREINPSTVLGHLAMPSWPGSPSMCARSTPTRRSAKWWTPSRTARRDRPSRRFMTSWAEPSTGASSNICATRQAAGL